MATCGGCSLPRKYDRLITREGFASVIAAITSSNWVTSPRITLTWRPRSSNEAAPGLISMQMISSPRAASSLMTRSPMNPVPPITKIDMVVSLPLYSHGSPVRKGEDVRG